MSISNDNKFELQTAGQADWDSGLNANFTLLERGYHMSGLAGADVNTGSALWITSGNFFVPFDPNSADIRPHAYSYLGASSGESLSVLVTGIVRSLGINSPALPGQDLFVSPVTPGLLVGSYSAAGRRVGVGVGGWGVYFNPFMDTPPERLTRSVAVNAVTGSLHLFSLDGGKYGWVREVRVIGNSADLVTLKFHSGSARVGSERLYETVSGGITTVGSFLDRAGWPYENTEAGTLSGLTFGSLMVNSAAAVGSDTINVQLVFDRTK